MIDLCLVLSSSLQTHEFIESVLHFGSVGTTLLRCVILILFLLNLLGLLFLWHYFQRVSLFSLKVHVIFFFHNHYILYARRFGCSIVL